MSRPPPARHSRRGLNLLSAGVRFRGRRRQPRVGAQSLLEPCSTAVAKVPTHGFSRLQAPLFSLKSSPLSLNINERPLNCRKHLGFSRVGTLQSTNKFRFLPQQFPINERGNDASHIAGKLSLRALRQRCDRELLHDMCVRLRYLRNNLFHSARGCSELITHRRFRTRYPRQRSRPRRDNPVPHHGKRGISDSTVERVLQLCRVDELWELDDTLQRITFQPGRRVVAQLSYTLTPLGLPTRIAHDTVTRARRADQRARDKSTGHRSLGGGHHAFLRHSLCAANCTHHLSQFHPDHSREHP